MTTIKTALNWIGIAFLLSGPQALFGTGVQKTGESLSAHEIMRRADTLDSGKTLSTNTTMVLIDAQGRERIREMRNFRKGENGQNTRTLVFFVSPSDVRNTGYLNYNWKETDQDDDSWLYLPALRKVMRVAGGDKSNSFMGSDFNYADLNGAKLNDWEYSLVNENEQLNSDQCWLIEAKPKADLYKKVVNETGYIKRHLWVRKDNFVVIKGKYWMERGNRMKHLTVKELEQVDGIWTAKEIKMETIKSDRVEHSSILRVAKVQYNVPIKDDFFNPRTLEGGL